MSGQDSSSFELDSLWCTPEATPRPLECITVQGKSSTTWKAPPLDGTMFLPEMVDWHMKYSATHPFAVLAGDNDDDYTVVTWGEVGRSVHILAGRFRTLLPYARSDVAGRPVKVGVLVNLDSLTYVTILLALLRGGFEPFALSTRNSVPALKHLLESTGTNTLIASLPQEDGKGTALENITRSLLHELPALNVLSPPSYGDLYSPVKETEAFTALPPLRTFASYKHANDSWPCIMLHSSGSTKFPKPIPISHLAMQPWSAAFWRTDSDICGSHWAAMGLPMFHSMGLMIHMIGPLANGSIPVVFRPTDPLKAPTPENILRSMQVVPCDFALAVPSCCEKWAQSEDDMKQLAGLKRLLYGGGPLPQIAGNCLVANGVRLNTWYGMTEAGALTNPFKSLAGQDWAYVSWIRGLQVRLVHEEESQYRLVVLDSREHPIAVKNVEGEAAYDTNDLMQAHPTQKGFYRLLGRTDDQLMMSNGEKTNPGPLEELICSNPLVSAAIMFGRGKSQVGVAIEPEAAVRFSSDVELEEFHSAIWPTIEKANALAPAHSHIFRELILVVDPSKQPFPRTPKGTVMRNAVLKELAQEIEALYEVAEQSTTSRWAQPPDSWTEHTVKNYVSQVVHGVMQERLGHDAVVRDDVDLFDQGCDSLQATYIRNAILNALRQAPPYRESENVLAQKITPTIVFTYHTITMLADFVQSLLTSGTTITESSTSELEGRAEAMKQMVAKYAKDLRLSSVKTTSRDLEEAAVLLTGSTGSLGTYLLQALLKDPAITRVYALNRKSASAPLLQRQQLAFKTRGVDMALLNTEKLSLMEADYSRPDLGLTAEVLDELRCCVTGVIHNAWKLDFNLRLASFESHVQGALNLVNLALSSSRCLSPRMIFTSSVGVVSNWSQRDEAVPETSFPDPNVAVGFGYGESKWVAERLIHTAVDFHGLSATVWRIGQMAGSTVNGAWSTTDWVPILVRGSQILGALPSYDKRVVTWLPVDAAARAILDSAAAPNEGIAYLNLVHPHPQQWTFIFDTIARKLDLPLVPYSEWFSRLEKQASEDPTAIDRNPAIRLLDFLRPREQVHDGDEIEALGTPRFATEKAVKISETLAALPLLTEDDVTKWLEYWTENGLLQ